MIVKPHHFSVGAIRLMVVADALKDLSQERVQSIIPTLPEEGLHIFHTDHHPHLFSYNTLYLHNGSEHILVDTGTGEIAKPEEGHLLDLLAQEGIAAADIDKIIITHFHGDHYGGMVTIDKMPVFPNAHIFVPRQEWAFWIENEQAPADRAALITAAFQLYEGRIHFFEDGESIATGVTAQLMPGHSAGHTGLMIESQNERLLHIADTLHLTLQFALPDAPPKFDYQPDAAAKTRWAVLARAADENLLTLAYHLPFPGLGRIQRAGSSFAWQPL